MSYIGTIKNRKLGPKTRVSRQEKCIFLQVECSETVAQNTEM